MPTDASDRHYIYIYIYKKHALDVLDGILADGHDQYREHVCCQWLSVTSFDLKT